MLSKCVEYATAPSATASNGVAIAQSGAPKHRDIRPANVVWEDAHYASCGVYGTGSEFRFYPTPNAVL